METLTRGKSVGRYVLGLRIVRDDGGPVTGRQALLRALTALVEFTVSLGGPSLICAVVTLRVKRIGDLAAGTYAISERHTVRLPPAPQAQPLRSPRWARQADIAVLPTGLALSIRQFLARSTTFTARRPRDQIASPAASADTLRFVSRRAAGGGRRTPSTSCAAVLADRRRRDADPPGPTDEQLRARAPSAPSPRSRRSPGAPSAS